MQQEPLLRAEGLSKIYSQGALAVGLHRFSASFYKGEFVAVTGSSGSGKSTLLNVLSALDSYDEGELYFMGEPTSHYTEEDRAKYRKDHVAFIFQDYNILDSYTVFQNIEMALLYTMPDPKARKARIDELIEAVGLKGHERQRCSKLSGGQKQRVSIARALAKDAPILFADEPCGNLDSNMTAEVMELLHRVSQDKLVIMVTHSYDEVAPYATRKIRLADGELVEDQVFRDVSLPIDEVVSADITKKQKFDALVKVATNNVRATPKRSFFGIFGLAILTAIFIIGLLLSVTVITLPAVNNGYYRYDLQVAQMDGTVIDDASLSDIAATDGVSIAYRQNLLISGYCGYEVGITDYVSYMRPECNLRDEDLYQGRRPQSADEVVVCLPASRRYLKSNVVGNQIDVHFYAYTAAGYTGEGTKMTVVGITLSDDNCAYFHEDFFRNTAYNTDTADKCVVVVTDSQSSCDRARAALRQKGYMVLHLYGDSEGQSSSALVNYVIVIALFVAILLVFRIITGSYRALEVSKRRDYNIMRTVGLPNNFVKSIYYVEMAIQGLIGWGAGVVITIIVGLIYGFAITPTLSYGFKVMGQYGLNLLWVALVALAADLIVTIGNAVRFNRYFYRQTVKMSLKEGANHD